MDLRPFFSRYCISVQYSMAVKAFSTLSRVAKLSQHRAKRDRAAGSWCPEGFLW